MYARLAPASSDVPTLDGWIESYIDTRVRASAGIHAKYRTNWARSFSPRIGYLPIDQVTGDDVARAVIELSEDEGLADKTVANLHGLLAGAMKIAHGRGLIPINPCLEVRLPRRIEHEQTEPRFITEAEYEQLRAGFHPTSSRCSTPPSAPASAETRPAPSRSATSTSTPDASR